METKPVKKVKQEQVEWSDLSAAQVDPSMFTSMNLDECNFDFGEQIFNLEPPSEVDIVFQNDLETTTPTRHIQLSPIAESAQVLSLCSRKLEAIVHQQRSLLICASSPTPSAGSSGLLSGYFSAPLQPNSSSVLSSTSVSPASSLSPPSSLSTSPRSSYSPSSSPPSSSPIQYGFIVPQPQIHSAFASGSVTMQQQQPVVHNSPQSISQSSDLLARTQTELKVTIEKEVEKLKRMPEDSLLDPKSLHDLCILKHEFGLLDKQLDVYISELRAILFRDQSAFKGIAKLVVLKQPFPKTIKQHTKTSSTNDDPVILKLLTGAKYEVTPTSHVRACVNYDGQSKQNKISIQNDTQDLDDRGFATFSDIRFPQGTRLKMIRMSFTLPVKIVLPANSTILPAGAASTFNLETEATNPFVVMTNENQWEISEGVLLKKEVLGQKKESSWNHFFNTLQVHYLKSTRQDLAKPQRPLALGDFAYIREAFFDGKDKLVEADFDAFWEWFGKVLHKIRHQRVIASLWVRGLIYGFISKEDSSKLLQGEEIGSFLIRFSERRAGQFAIAFVKGSSSSSNRVKTEVKHYLVNPDDIGCSKSLADFLKIHENFKLLVQRKTDFLVDARVGGVIKAKWRKNQVLEEYYYSKQKANNVDGYDEDIE